jgi:hypothetical protein
MGFAKGRPCSSEPTLPFSSACRARCARVRIAMALSRTSEAASSTRSAIDNGIAFLRAATLSAMRPQRIVMKQFGLPFVHKPTIFESMPGDGNRLATRYSGLPICFCLQACPDRRSMVTGRAGDTGVCRPFSLGREYPPAKAKAQAVFTCGRKKILSRHSCMKAAACDDAVELDSLLFAEAVPP